MHLELIIGEGGSVSITDLQIVFSSVLVSLSVIGGFSYFSSVCLEILTSGCFFLFFLLFSIHFCVLMGVFVRGKIPNV